jgi:hypothetical protein
MKTIKKMIYVCLAAVCVYSAAMAATLAWEDHSQHKSNEFFGGTTVGVVDPTDPNKTPGPSNTTDPNTTPDPSNTTDPNKTPGPTNTTDPNKTPGPSNVLKPSNTPGPNGTPKPSSSPRPSNTSTASVTPKPGASVAVTGSGTQTPAKSGTQSSGNTDRGGIFIDENGVPLSGGFSSEDHYSGDGSGTSYTSSADRPAIDTAPKTADAGIYIWTGLMVISALGLRFIVLRDKNKGQSK